MYKQLTSEQRYVISALLKRKVSKKEIAKEFGVSVSTIYREIKRNGNTIGVRLIQKVQKDIHKTVNRVCIVPVFCSQ